MAGSSFGNMECPGKHCDAVGDCVVKGSVMNVFTPPDALRYEAALPNCFSKRTL